MCGIWGCVNGHREDGVRALEAMAHRGPDARSIWISPDGRVILGHLRLAIIDLSPSGNQPMMRDNGRLTIVFNGEIYNFHEVKKELEGLGERFATQSDTEVILAAYDRWGPACVKKFNGMFAFALLDRQGGSGGPRIFMARDRIGKKPFYYSLRGGDFQFASELKGLKLDRPEVDSEALSLYLGLGYIPGTYSLVQGVKKLPPASWAMLSLGSMAMTIQKYWEIPDLQVSQTAPREEELIEELEPLLLDSVKKRMISDVPLGVFLSGGVDSSLVVAAAARVSPTPVKTFTITFPGHGRFNEADFAQAIASHFGTDHHVLEGPDLNASTIAEWATKVDEPLGDTSCLPTYWVSKLARKHVTVALGGDGGDELFAGYNHYSAAIDRLAGWPELPRAAWKILSSAAGILPPGFRGRNTLLALQNGIEAAGLMNTPGFDRALLNRFFRGLPPFLPPEAYLESLFPKEGELVSRMTRMDFRSYLVDDIMVKVDRASMACSLECRAPWLDYRIVEFAFSRVPDQLKVRGGRGRYLQRKLAERMLPPDFNHARKQGFSPPIDDLLRREGLASIRSFLEPLRPCIQPGRFESLWASHKTGRNNGFRLFVLAMLGAGLQNLHLKLNTNL